MAYGTVNADVIGTSVAGSNLGAGNASIMKNRIINGAMVIDQRNAGASVTPTVNTYTLDRWVFNGTQNSKISVQQNAGSVTPPVGFTNYLGVTSLSAYSVAVGDVFAMTQVIEGYNIADLAWGTANAKTVTLSFWVRSSLTGIFGGVFAGGQYYPFTYTISSANTWEQKTVTITGSTTGTWNSTNSAGITIRFGLGSGSTYSQTAGSWTNSDAYNATGATSIVGTNGATFYITGVQLEVGSSATGYEYVNYQTSLANCQRYFASLAGGVLNTSLGVGLSTGASFASVYVKYPVTMRTQPSAVFNTLLVSDQVSYSTAATVTTSYFGTDSANIYASTAAVQTTFRPAHLICNTSASSLQLSAEL
jgi:hypothetical protein